ncbi:MAG TPA: fibronectin type III domain-containing protein [Candidatus Thermoplasmatota archaeon]|nr:fibronectin type III domain-containing protein [Candidatus Thermoplasmatota archaeon]
MRVLYGVCCFAVLALLVVVPGARAAPSVTDASWSEPAAAPGTVSFLSIRLAPGADILYINATIQRIGGGPQLHAGDRFAIPVTAAQHVLRLEWPEHAQPGRYIVTHVGLADVLGVRVFLSLDDLPMEGRTVIVGEEHGPADLRAPEATSVRFDPPAVLRGRSTSIRVIAEDASGVRSTFVVLERGNASLAGGSLNGGDVHIDVPRDAPRGVWTMTWISLADLPGNAGGRAPANVTLGVGDLPEEPRAVQALAHPVARGIRVSWSPPGDTGGLPIVSYTVERTIGNATTVLAEVPGERHHLDDPWCPAFTTCSYRVSAANSAARGPASPAAKATGTTTSALTTEQSVGEDEERVVVMSQEVLGPEAFVESPVGEQHLATLRVGPDAADERRVVLTAETPIVDESIGIFALRRLPAAEVNVVVPRELGVEETAVLVVVEETRETDIIVCYASRGGE